MFVLVPIVFRISVIVAFVASVSVLHSPSSRALISLLIYGLAKIIVNSTDNGLRKYVKTELLENSHNIYQI